jgi:hypothetical protein
VAVGTEEKDEVEGKMRCGSFIERYPNQFSFADSGLRRLFSAHK